MPRKGSRTSKEGAAEEAIRRAGTIGELERLAGVGQADAERYEFWKAYARLPGGASLDAGVAELKRRIRTRATAP